MLDVMPCKTPGVFATGYISDMATDSDEALCYWFVEFLFGKVEKKVQVEANNELEGSDSPMSNENDDNDDSSPTTKKRGGKEKGEHDANKHGGKHGKVWIPWVKEQRGKEESKDWEQAIMDSYNRRRRARKGTTTTEEGCNDLAGRPNGKLLKTTARKRKLMEVDCRSLLEAAGKLMAV